MHINWIESIQWPNRRTWFRNWTLLFDANLRQRVKYISAQHVSKAHTFLAGDLLFCIFYLLELSFRGHFQFDVSFKDCFDSKSSHSSV